ncbi:putative oxidoreductase [Sulfodiicoccus acidiphilus]|uniref:Putative oxidoreductase n=1 Tax=Sulfodiicoccus acidiphilus TaxID=1670455 RepID=A0A348B4Z2_9CREN|nr:SDR family oxidoreductase [Sulfodiicoccus acidiphilus]BBD73244.1 putative oxidoreductase [Sulfodiicoccus acidiphilus]GGT89646.1 putative oxidoreductase [Sulfodiicoccus acidiphilus]
MLRKGKVCVVTGGAAGIGAAISYRLGQEGCHIVLVDVNQEWGKWREMWLKERGVDCSFVQADVSSEEQVRRAVSEVEGTKGRIDVLVNNAGVGTHGKSIEEQTLQDWRRVIDTNLTGTWLMTKYSIPLLKGGVIVNVASTRAFQSEPDTEPYSASKGGIVALTHSLAVSLSRYGIRVVSVSPGWIDTSSWRVPPVESLLTSLDHGQHLTGRVGRPEDVAALVSFLTSEDASWISGVNFTIDGGMTVKMIYLDEGTIGSATAKLTNDPELGSTLASVLSRAAKDQGVREKLLNLLRQFT